MVLRKTSNAFVTYPQSVSTELAITWKEATHWRQ